MAYQFFDPVKGCLVDEQVYGEGFLKFLYPEKERFKLIEELIFLPIAKFPLSSYLYGFLQKLPISKKKIIPFIQKFKVDSSEFLKDPNDFHSFNDFFIRQLKPSSRPINFDPMAMIKPADGRYLFYDDFDHHGYLDIKGEKLNLKELLGLEQLPWTSKTCVCMIRLAPVDYHRFHFPVDSEICETRLIKGPLFSVNPMAIKKNCSFLSKNKRSVTKLYHPYYKEIFMVEIGATHVGSIHQSHGDSFKKGEEKGYFEFGGSSIVLIFQNFGVHVDKIMLTQTQLGYETLGKMGETLVNF